MDLRAYIESGILELYVMETLGPAESREVELLAEQYPEIRAEIEAIRATLTNYAALHQLEPPRHLKEAILAQANVPEPAAVPAPPLAAPNSRSFPLLPLALGLLLIGALVYVFLCHQQSLQIQKEAQTRESSLQAQLEETRRTNQELSQQLALLLSADTRQVPLQGLPLSEDSQVVVYWSPGQSATFLSVRQLPAPPAGKQYQLWALLEGQPIDAGVFNVGSELQAMKPIAQAQAFAVTLEDEGGSATPTLEQMYVYGEIGD